MRSAIGKCEGVGWHDIISTLTKGVQGSAQQLLKVAGRFVKGYREGCNGSLRGRYGEGYHSS